MYAHSTKHVTADGKPDTSTWEGLGEHLTSVADLAQVLGLRSGISKHAFIAGIGHDLGKGTNEWQAYLRGAGPQVPHSAQGARWAQDRYNGIGRLLAYGMAGHHSGMPNGIGSHGRLTSLTKRMAETDVPPLPDGITLPEGLLPIPACMTRHKPLSPGWHFAAQLHARMVFSCLTDADYLATERFYARAQRGTPDRAAPPTLGDMIAPMEAELASKAASSGPLTSLRTSVLQHVRSQTGLAPGLFSLTVPTGGGKTLASLAFAMDHAQAHDMRRIIYVIPYTSIVEQTADVFMKALGNPDAVLEHHSSFDAASLGEREASQIRLATQNWDRPLVVTTAVQFFESLFSNRPSQCRKLHNISGSVIILDEAQTLPLRLLRPSLAALDELAHSYGCSIVLCTATQPALTVESGLDQPEALSGVRELAPDPAGLHEKLRRVRVQNRGKVTDEDLARELIEQPQSLVIVNARKHARDLYDRIAHLPGACHLTTAMTPKHRRDALQRIRRRLAAGEPVRLVATSLIEAGVDIDFPVVWRAIAGMDSIAQAAGRCNREGRLTDLGLVYVFVPVTEHQPPADLVKRAEVTAEIMRSYPDPLSLEAIERYFALLYRDQGHELDAEVVAGTPSIMKAISQAGNKLDYPMESISDAFQMIPDGSRPIIISGGSFGVPDALWRELEALEDAGPIARKLQPYQVQVTHSRYEDLQRRGALSTWRAAAFDQQFSYLTAADLYDEQAGLSLSNHDL